MNVLKKWMGEHSKYLAEVLANSAGTTLGTLRQLAGGYRHEGEPNASSDLAMRLENASAMMVRKGWANTVLRREQLSSACGRCEFVKKCRK